MTRFHDWLLLVLCNLIWASQFVMVKLVQDATGPLFAAAVPIAIATLLLGWRAGFSRRGASAPPFLLLGLAQVVAQLFITWGVRLSLAANAALLSLALPVITAVIAYLLLGERMTPLRWLSFALALAGAALASGLDWYSLDLTGFALGNAMILASICGSAFYNVYSKKVLTHYSPVRVLLFSYYVASAFLLPVTVAAEGRTFLQMPAFTWKVWLGLAVLAFFQYYLSMVIFLHVLARLDATQAALSNYLIPFFGLLLAWLILGERLTAAGIAGGALVLASTLLMTIRDEKTRQIIS
jgi:drug/metabolite transporter (DMT)-like permease